MHYNPQYRVCWTILGRYRWGMSMLKYYIMLSVLAGSVYAESTTDVTSAVASPEPQAAPTTTNSGKNASATLTEAQINCLEAEKLIDGLCEVVVFN